MSRRPVDREVVAGVEWVRATGETRRLLWLFGDELHEKAPRGKATAQRSAPWWRRRSAHAGRPRGQGVGAMASVPLEKSVKVP